jgi:hypothetical protein
MSKRIDHSELNAKLRGLRDHEAKPEDPKEKRRKLEAWKQRVSSPKRIEKAKKTSVPLTPEMEAWLKEKGIIE